MKLHDLKPAPGSKTAKRRVGRGIAAGQGKTAGRGTKGQKARAGGKIPAWFEGGQTPLHQRIPKLRGFRNPFKVEYEVVNLGDIARLVEAGELEAGDMPGAKGSKKGAAPTTVNQEILRAAGLVRRMDRPMKVLGGGELSAPLFVVADAFSASARAKIEGAGGTVSVLEVPERTRKAIGVDGEPAATEAEASEPTSEPADASTANADADAPEAETADEPVEATAGAAEVDEADDAAPATDGESEDTSDAPAPKKARARKPKADAADTDA